MQWCDLYIEMAVCVWSFGSPLSAWLSLALSLWFRSHSLISCCGILGPHVRGRANWRAYWATCRPCIRASRHYKAKTLCSSPPTFLFRAPLTGYVHQLNMHTFIHSLVNNLSILSRLWCSRALANISCWYWRSRRRLTAPYSFSPSSSSWAVARRPKITPTGVSSTPEDPSFISRRYE